MLARSLVVATLCAAACGNSSSGGSPDMATGTSLPAAYVEPPDGGGTMMPAALDCIGTRTDPAAPTSDTTVDGRVLDFQYSYPVAGAVVSVYQTAAQVMAGQPLASSSPSDMNGNYTLTVPKGAYRVILGNSGGMAISPTGGMDATIPTYEFGRAFDDPNRISVTQSTSDAIPSLVGVTQDPGNGVVAGSLRDCNDVVLGGGAAALSMTSASWDPSNLIYFKQAGGSPVPVRGATYTSAIGVFAALNVPVGNATVSGQVVVVSGAPRTLGSATVPILAGAITVVDVLPASSM